MLEKDEFIVLGVSIVITFLFSLLYRYIFLPPMNIKSYAFWVYVLMLALVFLATLNIKSYFDSTDAYTNFKNIWLVVTLLILVLPLVVLIANSYVFNAKSYSNLISDRISEVDISEYTPTLETVPLLDKDSAMLLANRTMGGLEEVISQFGLSDIEQIVYNNESKRVSVLEHSSFFTWLNNKEEGTPGYVIVDMKTQKAELVKIEGGIKYSHSEYFSRNIKRHLRKEYSKYIFGEITFELDEEGNPYYVATVLEPTIGLFGGKEVKGIVTVDAVTGDFGDYDIGDIPEWVDNAYETSLLVNQYNFFGKLSDGFFNSIFGKKGVRVTTEGYNYIPIDGDNWIYTGVTSAASDESNVGFVIMNKRTGKVKYFRLPGAEEYSAMDSSKGKVQHLNYTATFPLMLVVEGQPTYLVALKDGAGLVKMYGMVNVSQYQIVSVGETIKETKEQYLKLLYDNSILEGDYIVKEEVKEEEKEKLEKTGKIVDIRQAIKEGNTHYYINLEGTDYYYELSILDNPTVLFLELGEFVSIEYYKEDENKEIIKGYIKD